MSDEVGQDVCRSPAEKYGQESDFGQILDFIQSVVSDEALRHEFDIPHLVVVGRQNMAKTTLINRLIGRYLLPMRKGKTATHLQALTTHPILLSLRTSKIYKIHVSVRNHPNIGGEVENPEDSKVEEFLRQVAVQLPKEFETEISKTPVTVTLYGPRLSPLTLVDLPGVHFANDNDRMNVVTQSLVLDYIKKNKKSIIVIVSQVGDPTGDGAINLVMKHAEDYKARTICVLTKPDKHNESDDIGRKVATNQSHFTLEAKHFILLKGKDGTDPKESQWDAETTRVHEKEWFVSHKQYSDLLEICGIDRLMETMIKMLSDKMIVEIPLLIRKMEAKKKVLEQELKGLSQSAVPDTPEGKGDIMATLQYKLIDRLKILLFNNTTNSPGGEKVRNRFLKFHKEILQVNPLADRTDEEIVKRLRKLEGVSAPLGDSSENSQLLERLLYEEFHKENSPKSPAFGRSVILPSPIDTLTSICQKLVEDVEKELKSIVLTAVSQTLEVFPDLKKYVEVSVVNTIFERKQAETMTFIKQFIKMQKKSVDVIGISIPLPTSEIEDDILSFLSCQKDSQGKKLTSFIYGPQSEPELFTQIRHLSSRLHSDELVDNVVACNIKGASYKDEEQIVNTKKNVVRCFNTIKLNIIDTVPRCIQHFFVAQLVESLEDVLKSSDMMEFLKEKEDVRIKRERCERTLAGINHALPQTEQIPSMLLRIKQGRRAIK